MSGQKILGIDIGSNSLGWALLEKKDNVPSGILSAGVRVFDAGVDGLEADGRGESRNVKRRAARQTRRLLERRSRRLANLAALLNRAGLLPEGTDTPGQRHELLTRLDSQLGSPYNLRSKALDEKLSAHELGRALYHLGQRRGFLSNRKSKPKKDEKPGEIKSGISELERQIGEAGARTLGEHFSKIDPSEARIRGRYTSRAMYEDEFEKIWETQKAHHPEILSDDLKKKIHQAIFKQRPLKAQKHLIGKCSLEKDERRAPWGLMKAQRFRYLQAVNNLRVVIDGDERLPTPEERSALLDRLDTGGDVTFPQARKLLKLPRGSKFNLEKGGEEKIPGNRTASALAAVFGEGRWSTFPETERDALVEDLRSIVKEETLKKRGIKRWGLTAESAEKFGLIEPEEGYCSFSLKAVEKLLPTLEQGYPLATAINKVYPGRMDAALKALDDLPPVRSEVFGDLRNPVVERSLTELRKVITAVLQRHGKPDLIRIELARELRQPAKQREATWKRMRQNEKKRTEAAGKIAKEAGITKPSGSDILKVLLAEECNWRCPYTGRQIGMAALLGDHSQFDIEHIIPFDRSLDDSFLNKTLCYAEENRNVKKNKTPYEAYSGTEKWDKIISEVKTFKGDARDEKLKRFRFTEEDVEGFMSGFTSRQLNDTRYSSRRAKEYLGLIYGGADGIDRDGVRRVRATGGQATAYLRNVYGLNYILSDGPRKSRDDHRHHAVDAIAIALTDDSIVQTLSLAAKQGKGRRLFGGVPAPWEGFLDDANKTIKGLVVSHRVSKRVRGALHEETFYTKPRFDKKGKQYVHVRKPLENLSEGDIENIVDEAVKARVRERLASLGGNPKKAFKDSASHPWIDGKDGKKIPIHRVRLRKNLETFTVGEGNRARHVKSDSNHHMEIVEAPDGRGGTKWEGHVVSLYEAYQRRKTKEPIIKQNHGEGKRFLFSLSRGESIQIDGENGTLGLFVVRGINPVKQNGRIYGQVSFVRNNDSRKKDELKKVGAFFSSLIEPLRKRNCKKVFITPLGEVRYAND